MPRLDVGAPRVEFGQETESTAPLYCTAKPRGNDVKIGHWTSMVVQNEVVLGGPRAAATLDEIANAAESTRPQEDDMFSPRSSAAMTLTSIAMQPPPQQALFPDPSSPTALGSDSAKCLSKVVEFADEDEDDYFIDAKQAFQPPRETFVRRSSNSQVRTLSDNESKPAAAKIRRISVGNTQHADENAPSFRVSENRTEPTLPSSLSKDNFNTMPFSSSRSHGYGPSVLVSSYTIGPCAFSVTRSNPPPATAADFLPPPWNTPKWGNERPVHHSMVPSSYAMQPTQWEMNHPHGQPKQSCLYNSQPQPHNGHYYPSCYPSGPGDSSRPKPYDSTTTVTPTPVKKTSSTEDIIEVNDELAPKPDCQISASKVSSFKPMPPVEGKKGRQIKKTLGNLAETFIERYETMGQLKYDSNHESERVIVIDDLAKSLEVERRRIYDVVNILESLQIVIKMGKNTYGWMGREHLLRHFAIQQNEAIRSWPHHAVSNGIIEDNSQIPNPDDSDDAGKETNKSLTRLSQQFLQVFLVGFTTVSLPQASDIIQGTTSTNYDLAVLGSAGKPVPSDPKRFSQAAARGLKTKIRRLYDVANVLLAIGLIYRTEDRSAATVEGKRPHFHWNFSAGVTEFRDIYNCLPETMKVDRNPFYPEDELSREPPKRR